MRTEVRMTRSSVLVHPTLRRLEGPPHPPSASRSQESMLVRCSSVGESQVLKSLDEWEEEWCDLCLRPTIAASRLASESESGVVAVVSRCR